MWGAWFEYIISAPYFSYGKYVLQFSSRCNSSQFACSVSSLNSFVFIKLDMWKCIKLIPDKIWSIVSLFSCCILECFIYNNFFVYLHNSEIDLLHMHSAKYLVRFWLVFVFTVATDELLCLKNAGAGISMFFTSALMAKKNLKSWGSFWSYKQWQSSPFPAKMGQMGWICSAV